MEFASFLAGEKWSDHPACTDPLLATLARNVNDQMSDAGRQRLLILVPSVVGLTCDDPLVDVRLALMCATGALPVVAADTQRVLAVGILSAERRLAVLQDRDDHFLNPTSVAALASAPQAAAWARDFSAAIEPSETGFHTSGAPSIVCCSIMGIAVACTTDRDQRLLDLLTSGITLVQRASAAQKATAHAAVLDDEARQDPMKSDHENPHRAYQS